jgi:hypothetical protein
MFTRSNQHSQLYLHLNSNLISVLDVIFVMTLLFRLIFKHSIKYNNTNSPIVYHKFKMLFNTILLNRTVVVVILLQI